MHQKRESANGLPGLLTVQEAALTLRMSPATIYRAVERGDLRSVRLSSHGSIRIPASELDRVLTLEGEAA